MPAIQDTTIVDLQRQLDEYRAARDAALSEKAGLAEELAARDAALAQRDSEFSERIEHQSATIDVLKAMSASPGDAQPVFDLIVRRAVELCNAQTGGLLEYDGERVHVGTIHGLWEHDGKLLHVQSLHGTEANIEPASLAAYLRQFPMPPKRGSIAMRAILDCQIVHIRDMRDEIDLLEDVQRLGHKSQVSLPLLRDAKAIGVITIAAHEPGGFSESQIELLKTFAEQAVIAISSAETYRALQTRTSDLQESLEYQTATSEVLKVISGSDFELEPAFQAVVETATRLCHADQAIIYRYHDGVYRWAAGTSLLPDYERIERSISIPPGTGTLVGRVALERRPIEILDALTDPLYEVKDDALVGGIRTLLGVPLMRDGSSIGVIGLARQRVEAFTERQIELVKTFADQAVIAIENARLLTEQREALERQTAMAEVLQVINALPGNLKPVFDAILERAMRLCGAAIGGIYGYDGRWFHPVALRGVTPAFAAFSAEHPVPSGPNSAPMRILRTKRPAQVPDLADGSSYSLGMVDLGGIRSLLDVPLLKENNLLGFIAIYREEAGTFPDKQIALLEDFAAQAVIAMENARLLTEQREALEQQTATAEVLGVINANPGNLVPVFDAILQKAHSLCAASMGSLVLSDGYCFRLAASHGIPEQFLELGREPFPANTTIQRLIDGERLCHIQDVRTLDPEQGHEVVHLYQYADLRTGLIVPLRKDAALLGYITAYRREVRLFSEKEIALLESFAAQAVIAMENARLLNEQREALERQTATADILATINANPGDPRPVYETILTKAHALCGAVVGGLLTFDGTHLHTVAANGYPTAIVDVVWRPIPLGTVHQPMIAGERCVHVPDVSADPVLQDAVMIRAMLAHSTIRTLLLVPLRKDGAFVGQITAWREGVQPFAENEIALLESFAAQAVIAMENARLLTELRQRTEELAQRNSEYGERIEHQSATIDVLKAMSASPGDAQPVFDLITRRAREVCNAPAVMLFEYDGELVYFRSECGSETGTTPGALGAYKSLFPMAPTRALISCRAILDRQIIEVRDIANEPNLLGAARDLGHLSNLAVPLLRDGVAIGAIGIISWGSEGFSDSQIELMKTFAEQAVIAISSAETYRALHVRTADLQSSLEYQTATSDVLKVISRSAFNLQPVLETVVETAARLCHADQALIAHPEGDGLRLGANFGFPQEYEAHHRERRVVPMAKGSPSVTSRAMRERHVVHILDVTTVPGCPELAMKSGRQRTSLGVPLLREGEPIGVILLARRRVEPFTDRQIELVSIFADQAVIAMENARLLNELRQRQEELRITFENMGDGVAMFDESQHLVAWNGKFQEIFDLPGDLLEQHRTYEEHLRYLAARGDFGAGEITVEQIEELVATTGRPYGYERTRPDGRVIEIRRNPVPDGGFVLIFSDITERKRSEAEIRAARDTAEEASHTIEAAYRDLKAAQANLIQAEKMASLGQLTAGIAHEIKNPLNFVNNFAALSVDLLDELKETAAPGFAALTEKQRAEVEDVSAMLTSNLEKITEHGRRADSIVKAMLEHSRGSSGERRMVDLNALIDEALNLAYHGARAQDQRFNVTLERDFGEGLAPIEVNPQDITRVFLNIFSNGFYATTKQARDGGFQPTLKVTTRDAGDAVEVRVRDNGTGIPADIRDMLFQPFFTTKPTGEGTGLGLSITYDIVTQQHSGSITVDSKVGEYSEFTIQLPRCRP